MKVINNLGRLVQIDKAIDRIVRKFNNADVKDYPQLLVKWDGIQEKLYDKRDLVIKELRSYRALENRKDKVINHKILMLGVKLYEKRYDVKIKLIP